MAATPISPRAQDRQKARLAKLEEKWSVLFNQKTRAPIYSVDMYIDNLHQCCDGKKNRLLSSSGHSNLSNGNSNGSNICSTNPTANLEVSHLLQKLRLDLKMSYQWFIEDFCKRENNGLTLLLNLLRNIQKIAKEMNSVPSKEKAQTRKRLLSEELDCLVCVKFCLRAQMASKVLLDSTYGLESVASALMSSFTKSRIAALEIMSLILREPGGFSRNVDCFTYFRLKNCEPVRFKFLVSMLMSRSDGSLSFQVCCMRYLNSLITFAPNSNIKVFFQTELEMAGVDPNVLLMMIEDNKLPEKDDLIREILDFQNSQIDVDTVLETNKALHEKLSQAEKQTSSKTKPAPPPPPPPPPPPLPVTNQIRTAPAQMTTETQHNPNVTVNVDVHVQSVQNENSALQRLTNCLQELKTIHDNENTRQDINECNNNEVTCKDEKVPFSPRAKLPYLYWTVIGDVENTMFKHLNYERVLQEIELFELEESFKIGQEQKQDCPKPLREKSRKSKIRFMEPSRAKNLSILQKKIGRSPLVIKEYIEEYDVDALLSDNAELLLKFIPTETEMRTIMELDFQLEDLDEAEQMLVQLMSIARLEDRLRLMIFMDSFPRVADTLLPPIADLMKKSTCLLRCTKLQKIFEIILAVGNFINGNRKQACGFRVSSLPLLEQIRSGDRSLNLLEYIAELVVRHYYDVHDWYDDLDILNTSSVSFQSLLASVKEMDFAMSTLQREITETNCQRLIVFHEEMSTKCCKIQKEFREMESVYRSLCTMFGENASDLDSQEFFKLIHNFAESYRMSDKQLNRQRWRMGITLTKAKQDKPATSEKELETRSPRFTHIDSAPVRSPGYHPTENRQEHAFTFEHDIAEKEIVTLSEQSIEDWVVNSPPPSACTDVLREESFARIHNLDQPKEEMDSIFDYETESEDSAFVGSEGQYLRSSSNRKFTFDNGVLHHEYRSNFLRKPSPPPEPFPDYSVCGTFRFDDEVDKVLSDFEGKLNEYCTIASVPVYKGYLDMRSEIYI
eukprot:XP_019920340.1 PREDICTED: formin-like protein CG32138 isoform X2 [Crassostrea gigas]